MALFVALGITLIIDGKWPAFLILLSISGFMAYLFMNTYYVIADNVLSVHTGFNKIGIDVAAIKYIEDTPTLWSAATFSLGRLEVFYNRYDSVVISPPDKTAFIAHLKTINNNIEVRLKERK
ncbi:PH domain-containing protein [Mucilaginibacter antarcticus]|uniref:PH domain-containing protein n=1 Tax=Mucilaginibacter antarcticus TaxID=1855725 RepID=UPI003626D4C5